MADLGLKAPFLKMKTIGGTDFKYSLHYFRTKDFLVHCIAVQKNTASDMFFHELAVSTVIFRNIDW